MIINRDSKCFKYFNFEKTSYKNKTVLKRLGYCFSVESTENETFPYKKVLSKINVEKNEKNGYITKHEVLP